MYSEDEDVILWTEVQHDKNIDKDEDKLRQMMRRNNSKVAVTPRPGLLTILANGSLQVVNKTKNSLHEITFQ